MVGQWQMCRYCKHHSLQLHFANKSNWQYINQDLQLHKKACICAMLSDYMSTVKLNKEQAV